ncbi:McrC family protein [Gudongella sp. SC589]|jgi:5-methylcytosine-specific restriction enzyme subunit McrC|uniref:McrC family protein n=1 Tax=Gudongella sp. SC589 TaxID=3385990 RepID=UPI003904AF70
MHTSKNVYAITEYGGFTNNVKVRGYERLPEQTFRALEEFILTNREGTNSNELLTLSSKRNLGKLIIAKNYVGVISMTDGTVIEILPKIVSEIITPKKTKDIFLEMLGYLDDMAFKDFNLSHLNTGKMNILEIFIKMFLSEVSSLTKQGLKSSYTTIESNERFYKGKLVTTQDIKHNSIIRDKFFVRYDEFNLDRPENRIIKSTLRLLMTVTRERSNRVQAIRLINFFDGVPYSKDYEKDLSKCSLDRGMKHYNNTLTWCRIFLKGNSFTSFSGNKVAIALLFPMEKVFESYVTKKIKRLVGNKVDMWAQGSRYCLFDRPRKAFSLRPDIVLERKGEITVIDAKWKLLSSTLNNYGISQADMYQMYAYSKKYNAKEIILLYPKSDAPNNTINYTSEDGVRVSIKFVDLTDADNSIASILEKIF